MTTDLATELASHLIRSRLVGSVQTSPRNTVNNSRRLVRGDDEYTFGIDDWRDATVEETVGAVQQIFGGDPLGSDDPDGAGWIDPEAALDGIALHRRSLRDAAASGGIRTLFATGHPTGLLAHYQALARGLQTAGSLLLAPLDDEWIDWDRTGRRLGVRFLDGVACVFDGGSLRHTHRSVFMEAMLDAVGVDAIDLVVGDHGMAGAAIAVGLPTLSIADVNDCALPLAQVRGRTDGVLPIDDNLAPSVFVPVTAAMLDWR
ncbi:MAG: phosphatase [Actinobacteria bacterium]|nr:phosphatase [Actinomycetota bacterium]